MNGQALKPLTLTLFLATFALAQKTVTESGRLALPIGSRNLLEVRTPDNVACQLRIVAQSGDSAMVSYQKWLTDAKQSTGDRLSRLIEVRLDTIQAATSALRLRVLSPTKAPWQGKEPKAGVTLEIVVPPHFNIDIKSANGNLDLLGPFDTVRIASEYSAINLKKVTQQTVVKTSYCDVKVSDLSGRIEIAGSYSGVRATRISCPGTPAIFETSYGLLTIEDVVGQLQAITSYGAIEIANVDAGEAGVILRTSYGRIIGRNIRGELSCETSYNTIDISELRLVHGMNYVSGKFAPISVALGELAAGQLVINNTYSNVELHLPDDISARLSLSVDKGGKIHTSGIPLKPLIVEKDYLEGLIGDGDARIEINVDGIGEIKVLGK